MGLRINLGCVLMGALLACSDPASPPMHDAGDVDSGMDNVTTCSRAYASLPMATDVHYVAINQPGASNEDCDGRAPTDEGNGRCPFKDLASARVRDLLNDVHSVRMELREGTYVIQGWDGLRVAGTGSSAAQAVVLTSFPGERAVLDTPAPDGAGCTADNAPSQPQCVRQVLRMTGQHTVVQGLTIQNGLGYQLEVNGGAHHVVRCNLVRETVPFSMRSDMLKVDGDVDDVEIAFNDLTQWRSQAIDMTNVSNVHVHDNEFHHPFDADGGAVGCKWGARDVTVENNDIHDFGDDVRTHVFSMGGTGSPHDDDAEAYRIRVIGNHIRNIRGIVAQVVGCQQCAIEGNHISDVGAGILLSDAATGLPECSTSVTGCLPSRDTVIANNRFRRLHGGGDASMADTFIAANTGETTGLSAHDNLYCASDVASARFVSGTESLTFDAWRSALGIDASSTLAANDDSRCTTW